MTTFEIHATICTEIDAETNSEAWEKAMEALKKNGRIVDESVRIERRE